MSFKGQSEPAETARQNTPDPAAAEQVKREASHVAEVSHELRLPIANIRLLVETLLDGALEDQDVCRRMLKRAYQEVERLQSLVKDLLSLEQVLQSSGTQLQCQWIELAERARYAADSVATMALSKGVEVRLDIQPGFKIYANREQLDQVLLNLVENAVKFTPAGGLVTIKSGAPGAFSVSDTGIGIPEAEITKIFQRFYRVDRSQSKGSTGLGLSIVKNIVELHGARMNVESSEGKGSCFKLEFPPPARSTP
jgi:two-component system phosphate regulon sensor histidine kinase PhoR